MARIVEEESIPESFKNASAEDGGINVIVKVSHYTPWTGGTNCSNFQGGSCISKMANGEPWQNYINVAIACPIQWPFETRVVVLGETWYCKDRGGAIVKNANGSYWIDMLTADARVPFGAEVEAIVYFP